MSLLGKLWKKIKERREEEQLLKKIYETRKEEVLRKERRKAAHEMAEKHAKEQAKKEWERKGKNWGRFVSRMPIVQNPLDIGINMDFGLTPKHRKRKFNFADYL